ncbi:hypothetical protein [Microvirga puerhi]|uniref:Uncharacterized protein n=1 Tax=Microvirga puerhi TaxID=2876078 RepID=A0ABS7VIG2_9HYPH|nr:hypothetical protein [Microvirga puerhi]MBZ6074880.1 hypothetical protein [Microvirga puerhi]
MGKILRLCAATGLATTLAVPRLGAAETFGFVVDLSLSPKAASGLAAHSEGIVIAAFFSGAPAPTARTHADEFGQIFLGSERITVDSSVRSVPITGKVVPRNRLEWVQGRKVQVPTNVYSACRKGPDNILDCDIFEGEISVAAQTPVKIGCRPIGE